MAARGSDLITNLILGGISPTAARLIANAIGNANSPSFSAGGDTADATPTEQLRLISSDDRRYTLTNLDYTPAKPFQDRIDSDPNQYQGAPDDHPYKDAQPLRSAPPLSAPPVRSGRFINVEQSVESNSGVSTVNLNIRGEQGRHPRADKAAGTIDLVDFTARSESPKFLSAECQEGDSSTDLVVSLRNTESATILLPNGDTRKVLIFPEADAVGPNNGTAGVNRPLESVTVTLNTGAPMALWAWPAAAAGSVPAWWAPTSTAAGTLRAWVVFNGTRNETDTGGSTNNNKVLILSQSNVASVFKREAIDGTYEITMTTAMPDTLYAVIATAGAGAANEPRVVHLRTDGTNAPTTTTFRINVRTPAGNNASDAARVSVAVFE